MPWPQRVNAVRAASAGARDARLADRIMNTPAIWDTLPARTRQIVLMRKAYPELSWAGLAGRLDLTKSQAWTVWRRLVSREAVRELAG